MLYPTDLKYSKSHEWVKMEDGVAVIGISDFAQDALGDVVFVNLPGEGDDVTCGEAFGDVESVKAVSDLVCPVTGAVCAVNEDLLDQPLISSRQGVKVGVLGQWLGDLADEMDVRATYNLPLNAKFLVRQGIGSAFTYRGLFEANELSDLAFVPLSPTLESTQGLVWRKTLPTRQAQAFLDTLKGLCAERDFENPPADAS